MEPGAVDGVKLQGAAQIVVPNLVAEHAVKSRELTRAQQEVDGSGGGARDGRKWRVYAGRGAKGLAKEASLGVRDQAERLDHLLIAERVHAIARLFETIPGRV